MAEESKKGEAEGLAQSVLGVLGLSDIIIGGLFLYAAFDFQQPTQPEAIFHTTGFSFVDVALLACAAALLGKVLSLLAFFVMGVARAFLRKSGAANNLRSALKSYARTNAGKTWANDSDPLQFASRIIALDNAAQAAAVEKIQGGAVFAYSAGFDCVLYAIRLWSKSGPLHWAVAVVAALLILLGFLLQVDYVNSIADALFAQIERPPGEKNAGAEGSTEGEETR